jgi:PEP-CTERM motif
MNSRLRTLVAAPLLGLAANSVFALGAPDPQNDFLPTYTGVHAGDLDVLFAYGLYNAGTQSFTFGATMSAPIGTTAGALYVWGFDRGAGTERFVTGTPSVGAGVFFDSVLVLTNTGSATVNLLNGTTFTLAAGAVDISGNSITATVPAADLPSRGRSLDQYGWNLWPRLGAGNAAISDFAPDASTPIVATVVPEPATAALLLAGGLALLTARRRKTA